MSPAIAVPVGSGFVMWKASAPDAQAASSARAVTPRFTARARGSRTTNPAPSPRLVPFLRRSKGRHGSASSAPSELNPPTVSRQRLSHPPARTASTSPVASHAAATTRALAPLEQALEIVRARAKGPIAPSTVSAAPLSGYSRASLRSLRCCAGRRAAAPGAARSRRGRPSSSRRRDRPWSPPQRAAPSPWPRAPR